jgi:hypothetical protein
MAKAFVHFIVLGALFGGVWFALSNVNFVELFHVKEIAKDNEHKLGELFVDAIKKRKDELESDSVQTFLDNIKQTVFKILPLRSIFLSRMM